MSKQRIRHLVTIFLLVGSLIASAESVRAEQKQFYFGLGGSYQLTNLAGNETFKWDSDSWGVNANFGYRLTQSLYTQIDVDYIPEVGASIGDLAVLTGFFSLKGYVPDFENLKFTRVRPYVIVGAGVMHYNFDPDDPETFTGDDKQTGPAYKGGVGFDIPVGDAFCIDFEGNYTVGTNNVRGTEYFNFILGAAYHF
jgi:hypothetical protein